ncbi:hypothetical protein [Halocalculus aciditolerans]|uniref:Uncharacterized protein n=1 Tax=Halocalculus aciditolerans TaxID=1383812 RepID=A0A830FGV4_9EURY|nr:hypothetical protein [Halocalculus aciditolerans]GGL51531.1 hypothetical protein GCM10009039_07260 [Halocalculus aciditolerans]
MSRTLHALLVVLVVLVAVPGGAAGLFAPAASPASNNTTSGATTNDTAANDTADRGPGFGVRLTGFMAESAADADTSVEQEFWEQDFERSRNHTRAAMGRTNDLRERYSTLQERQRDLLAMRANDTGPGNSVEARLRAVNASLDALADAIDHTTEMTHRHNATPPELDELRDAVRNHSRGRDADRGRTGKPPWAGGGEGEHDGERVDARNATNGSAEDGGGDGRPTGTTESPGADDGRDGGDGGQNGHGAGDGQNGDGGDGRDRGANDGQNGDGADDGQDGGGDGRNGGGQPPWAGGDSDDGDR